MKRKLRDLIRRVEFWPEERQENAAKLLLEMEAQARSSYRLTDEQAAEVERRLGAPNPKYLPLNEVRARFAKLGA